MNKKEKKQKVYELLATHEKTNVELAWALDEAQKLGVREQLEFSFKDFLFRYSLSDLFLEKELYVKHRNLTGIPPDVGLLTQLTYISFECNKITYIPKEICSLPNLKGLRLDYNEIHFIPKEIGQLSKLRELLIERNYISRLPIELGDLNHIKWLDIRHNPLAHGEITKIRKLLPYTDIW